MTITDLLDQTMREMGCDPKKIEQARQITILRHPDFNELNRELSEDEIPHFRAIILMHAVAMCTNPEFRQSVMAAIKSDIELN